VTMIQVVKVTMNIKERRGVVEFIYLS